MHPSKSRQLTFLPHGPFDQHTRGSLAIVGITHLAPHTTTTNIGVSMPGSTRINIQRSFPAEISDAFRKQNLTQGVTIVSF